MPYIETFPAKNPAEGVTLQVLAQSPDLMVVSFTFEKGGEGALHSHPHVQSTFCESGHFVFSIDGEEFDVKTGDSFIIPSNAEHGCKCLEAGRLIDTFTPRRDDFL